MKHQEKKYISKAFLIWLILALGFLAIGLFLFLQKLASSGSDILGPLTFPHLVSIVIILSLVSLVAIYKSLNSASLKYKYWWVEIALFLLCINFIFILETLNRTGFRITDLLPLKNPSNLGMPLLLLATGCA